jgi:predicted acetyltransferase
MPRYRAGGAAIKLRRAARDGVDAGVRPFLYAHPNDRMLQIHVRVGHQPLGRMVRLARPTRLTDRGIIGRIGTLGLRAARVDRLGSPRDEYEIEISSLPADLDDLFEQLRPTLGTALVRDVRYLTWRFLDCPLHEYRFVLARRASQLSGYLVFCVTNDQLLIKDWLALDTRAVRTLFSAAIDQAYAANAASASVTLLETHRDRSLIRGLGFATRPETSTSITYAPESLPWRADVMSADAWYMTVGDRDV